MAGTKKGAMKAAETNKRKYGEDYYKNIGSEGGKKKHPRGFSLNPEFAAKVSRDYWRNRAQKKVEL